MTQERPNTISGLQAKRKELLNLHTQLMATAKLVIVDVRTIDACIRLFDPEAQADRIGLNSYDPSARVPMGRSKRFILDRLRAATAPITSREIADAWIKDRGLEPNRATREMIVKRVRASLTTLRREKLAANEAVDGSKTKVWRLTDNA